GRAAGAVRHHHDGRGREARPRERGARMTAQTLSPTPAPGPPPTAYDDLSAKKPWYKSEFYVGRAVKAEELMNFSRQTASFLRPGIPILDSLAVVGEENASKKMQEVLAELQLRLRAGSSFGDAIALHPKVFPGYYVAIVRAAELTGRLDDAFDSLAEYLEREVAAKKQLKSALTYPTIVFLLAIVAVIIMSVYVLPKFKSFYKSLGAHLPLPTRMLLGFTTFMAHWGWLVALVIVAIGIALAALFGGQQGKARRDRTLLKLPA